MDRSASRHIESGRGNIRSFEAKPKVKPATPTKPPSARDWLSILPGDESNLRPALEKIVERKKKKNSTEDGVLPQDRGGRRSRSGEVVRRDGKVKSDQGSE